MRVPGPVLAHVDDLYLKLPNPNVNTHVNMHTHTLLKSLIRGEEDHLGREKAMQSTLFFFYRNGEMTCSYPWFLALPCSAWLWTEGLPGKGFGCPSPRWREIRKPPAWA